MTADDAQRELVKRDAVRRARTCTASPNNNHGALLELHAGHKEEAEVTEVNDAALDEIFARGACTDTDTHDVGVRFIELAHAWAVADDGDDMNAKAVAVNAILDLADEVVD